MTAFPSQREDIPVKRAGGDLGPKQIAWLRENMDVFKDAERRAREAIADTERMKREAGHAMTPRKDGMQ